MNSVMIRGAVIWGVVIGGLFGSGRLVAQSAQPVSSASSPVNSVLPPSLPAGIDEPTRKALVPVFARAREAGLPLTLLSTKAAEGVLRGVPPARIISVVSALTDRLVEAKQALGSTNGSDLSNGAYAISVGVPVEVLREIRRRLPTTSVAVPLAVLAQWVEQGVPVDRARDWIFRLLDRGVKTQELANLRDEVDSDVRLGEPVVRALDARAAILSSLASRPNSGAATSAAAAAALSNSKGGKQ